MKAQKPANKVMQVVILIKGQWPSQAVHRHSGNKKRWGTDQMEVLYLIKLFCFGWDPLSVTCNLRRWVPPLWVFELFGEYKSCRENIFKRRPSAKHVPNFRTMNGSTPSQPHTNIPTTSLILFSSKDMLFDPPYTLAGLQQDTYVLQNDGFFSFC